MCCFATALMFFGPRMAFLVYWLIAPVRVNLAVANFSLPWLVSICGLLFLPWTMLMYVILFPMNREFITRLRRAGIGSCQKFRYGFDPGK
jgi:hypothetical protein